MKRAKHNHSCHRQAFMFTEHFIREEVLSEHESLSMTTMIMFCKREKAEVLIINQQNDKPTQEKNKTNTANNLEAQVTVQQSLVCT